MNHIKRKINKILIANRGEIAIRIMKTAKLFDIKTVAIHSSVDENALFASFADEKIDIGGTTSRESYLVIDKIIDACKKTGADAIHPGYGFLSEKPEFVEKLEKEGIIFIGPSANSMKMMGDKITSKETAKLAGVSVVPGFLGVIEDEKDAKKIAKDIGFPIIIKASAGGGGKGMKIVYTDNEILSAIESAKNEARNAFGDDRLFIEKYIERPRHIEVQIIADKYGNVVCLGERECSIQRFNQKVIEESPSSFVDELTRQKMYEQSVKLAKACGYYSAGTIEYIMDSEKNFYFLEMNTRLQVEHPVTEFVTGKDLVSLMIKVAEGQELGFEQKDISINGSAIECRICAEDPRKGFMPSIGRISYYKEPKSINNVAFRIDSGVTEGSEISQYYDSMIAKVITYGDTRVEAIDGMKKVLGQFEINGVSTNTSIVEDIIRDEDFINGNISTWFIKEKYPNGFKGSDLKEEYKLSMVAAAAKIYLTKMEKNWSISGKSNLIRSLNEKVLNLFMQDEIYEIRYHYLEDKSISMLINDRINIFSSDYKNGDTIVTGKLKEEDKLGEKDISVKIIDRSLSKLILSCAGVIKEVKVMERSIGQYQKYMSPSRESAKTDKLKSPISGMLVRFFVNEGDVVHVGQEILTIEAMKMENIIRADFDTKIRKIYKKNNEMVSIGELIVDFDNS